jgi:ABC-type sugar transport system substrate-binding protein
LLRDVLVFAVVVLVAPGCGDDSGGGDRVGVVIKSLDNPFFATMEQ